MLINRNIYSVIKCIAYIVYLICNYRFVNRIRFCFNLFYSAWISFNFKEIGKGVKFQHPVFLVTPNKINIGDNVSIGRNCILACWENIGQQQFNSKLTIGNNSIIGDNAHITAINCIKIGNGVLTGRYCTITDNMHGSANFEDIEEAPDNRHMSSKGATIIGDNVWIGDKVTILAGISIGNSAIIGANSVVSHDIPPYAVVGGSPARVIKIIK